MSYIKSITELVSNELLSVSLRSFHSRRLALKLSEQLINTTDSRDSCQIVKDFGCSIPNSTVLMVCKVIIISLAAVHLLKELFQLFQVTWA